jgi:hypothetical protein
MAEGAALPNGIARIVFREILEGDRRKFVARSNDSDSGGGARDLRFRSWESLKDVLGELFPGRRAERRRRGGVATSLTVYVGRFYWLEEGQERSQEALLEPPTDARAGEGRIAQVHKYGCFGDLPEGQGLGRTLVLFVQNEDGKVWPVFASESSLEKDDWHPDVAEFLLNALRAKRRQDNAAYGYIDFVKGAKFVR